MAIENPSHLLILVSSNTEAQMERLQYMTAKADRAHLHCVLLAPVIIEKSTVEMRTNCTENMR